MAEAIPYGTISNILFKLGSLAFKELGLIFKANKELEKLQETLGTINAVLLDAEQAAESSELVKNWISRLHDVVYDADDLLDEFQYEHLRQKVHSAKRFPQVHINLFSSSSPLAFRLTLGRRVKSIRGKLDEVAADINKFNLGKRVMIDMGVGNNTWRETDSSPKSEIIGRNQNKEDIRNLLLQPTSNQDNFSIVAVVGFGGLGKTALAQLVYNEPTIESHFSPKIWVCVSDQFDIKLLIKNILKCAGVKVGELDPQEILQKKLKDVLGGKRYLIVLDDVWNEDFSNWNTFLGYLVDGAPGSRILVTTRNRDVASAMGIKSPYVLKGLSRDQSWELFKHVVAFRGQNEINRKLELIGKKVVERCKGVPLAIITLAGLMRRKPNEIFWSSIEDNQEVWKSVKNEQGIMSVLKLSYNHLPSHLRPCFAFCSIFPKDFEIPKDKLIQLWNALGYIQSSISNKSSLDLGDEYYEYLLSRSFFQEEKDDESGRIVCKMHDLIHDLAQSVAGSSFYTVKNDKQKIPEKVRHLFLECKPSQKFETKGIRTILTSPYISIEKEVTESCSSLNWLRMLDLRIRRDKMLPNSIGKLKHLRFLDLSDNYDIEVLPDSITNLHNLQTLLLENCGNLNKLPKDISKLISLECLNIEGCRKLNYLPKGLGELTSLQRLSNFIVNTDAKEFSTSATLNELKDLNYLGGNLKIVNLGMVRDVEFESSQANLKEKTHLESLMFRWAERVDGDRNNEKDELLLDNLEPHPNLKKLEIIGYRGTRFSSWLSSLTNLTSLWISNSCRSQQLPRLDHLPFLEFIMLRNLSALEYVEDDGIGKEEDPSSSLSCSMSTTTMFFPSLKKLALYRCENLKGWWRRKNKNEASTSELPCFPCLSLLCIWNCPNLTSMPLFPSLNCLSLKNASIMPFQQTLTMKANKTSTASSASSSRSCSTAPPLSNLKILNLERIDDLETLPEEFLLNLASLETLEIGKCPQVQSLPGEMHRLTFLKELIIYECPKLSEQDREDPSSSLSCSTSTTTVFFPFLKKLVLRDCENLKGWWRRKNKNEESTSELPCFPCLSSLEISNCPNLTFMPLFPCPSSSLSCSTSTTIVFFPFLKKLVLCDCENLEGWWRRKNKNEESTSELPCFPCLSSLEISNCPNLTFMPLFPSLDCLSLRYASIRPLQQTLTMKANKTSTASSPRSCSTVPPLSNLKKMNLVGIDDLETLPEEFLLNLTSLKTLKIDRCPQIQSLSCSTSTTTEFPCFPCLSSLKIYNCPNLSALENVEDDGIGKEEDHSSSLSCSTSTTTTFFPSLKKLELRKCKNLKGWWRRKNKNEESTSELPCFPCLSSLEISNCPNLTSMPLFPSLDRLTLWKASIIPFQQTLTTKANKTSTASSSSSSSSRSCSTAPPLSNLKTLKLLWIDDIETLPEEFLLNLTSLQTLHINKCPQVQSLPGEMLASLKQLVIYRCPNLSEACTEESGIPNINFQDRWVRGKDGMVPFLLRIIEGRDRD